MFQFKIFIMQWKRLTKLLYPIIITLGAARTSLICIGEVAKNNAARSVSVAIFRSARSLAGIVLGERRRWALALFYYGEAHWQKSHLLCPDNDQFLFNTNRISVQRRVACIEFFQPIDFYELVAAARAIISVGCLLWRAPLPTYIYF